MAQVRSSKYRHVYGDPTRKDKCYDNIRLTKNAFDANLAKSNGKYISLNWDASGGGSFAVIPTAEQGKLPDRFPLFDGHRGPVLDTDWNPFDEDMVVSASEDGTIGVWRIPEKFSVHQDYGSLDDCKDVQPEKFLKGHGKKVGHVAFNPVAENILASASLDNTVKIWDIESGEVLFTLKHPSFVTSLCWNYDGTKLATVAKDKQLRIWDVRAEKIISEGKGHAGAKGSRVIWLGDADRVLTTGFSLISDREMALWDSNDIAKGPIDGFRGLDPSSGIVIPHYDPMTSMVYLGGRGDGKIVYYEFADDNLYDLFAYNSTSPQRGLGWVPNRSLDPHNHEVARVYKVHETLIEPIPFRVPLKTEGFLDNVYTFVEAGVPALSAKEWQEGKTKRPLVKNWKDVYEGKDAEAKEAPVTEKQASNSKPASKSEPKAESKEAKLDTKSDTKSEAKSESKSKSDAKSVAKSETKSETKSEAKSEPKSDTKSDAKAEIKPESSNKKTGEAAEKSSSTSKAQAEEVAALDKAEKQDSYDVLQSDDVKKFLAKNSEEKEEEDEEEDDEDSAWKEEEVVKNEPKTPTSATSNESEPRSEKTSKSEASKSEASKSEAPKSDVKNGGKTNSESQSGSNSKNESVASAAQTLSKIAKEVNSGEASKKNSSTGKDAHEESKLDEIIKKLDDLSARISKLEASSKH